MADVIPITPPPAAVDAAWERLRELLAATIEHPLLLVDRQHFQNIAKAERDFKRLFLASEQGKPASASIPGR